MILEYIFCFKHMDVPLIQFLINMNIEMELAIALFDIVNVGAFILVLNYRIMHDTNSYQIFDLYRDPRGPIL